MNMKENAEPAEIGRELSTFEYGKKLLKKYDPSYLSGKDETT